MSNQDFFHFKSFKVKNKQAAMKIGTDGVLLASWTNCKSKTALDIGSGTGVIALILANQHKAESIDAIDIEKNAFEETKYNFQISDYSPKLNAFHSSLQNFLPQKKYDLIVSNPPFFINSQQSKSKEKSIAKHTINLEFEDIIDFSIKHLEKDGILNIILPYVEGEIFIQKAIHSSLYLKEKCEVFPLKSKTANRLLLSFSKEKNTIESNSLTIYNEDRTYTKEYKTLTSDLYLNH